MRRSADRNGPLELLGPGLTKGGLLVRKRSFISFPQRIKFEPALEGLRGFALSFPGGLARCREKVLDELGGSRKWQIMKLY